MKILSAIFFSRVKDCIADMVTFTTLAKSLSLGNYYNTSIAGLGENIISQKLFSYLYDIYMNSLLQTELHSGDQLCVPL